MQGNNYQLDKEPLLKIPIIINVDSVIENRIIELVDCILQEYEINFDNPNIYYFEDEINNIIYKLYDLNEEEIDLIESSI